MAGLAPEGSQFDARQYDAKMNELLGTDGQDFFTSYDEVCESFDAMGLQENLLRGIYAYGFEKPSAIQQRGIVPFCKGLDVIRQAQSGAGKTATFCSGVLQQLDYSLVECQALVLAPTRELAQQIEKVMRALGDYLGVKVHACVGGTSVREDQRILSSGVHVVVGTPGRVFDMLRSNHCALITSGCLYWMRQMRCSLEVSRIRSMIFFSCCHLRSRLGFSLPQCLLKPWKSQGSL
uniref:ATP-dependent RNA helicase n=1 Tax=Glycine max TaxID=3847 RepID=C6TNV5_SOYBN|nr:unknown [Glycine max]